MARRWAAESRSAGRSGDASRHCDELPADGRGGRLGVECRRESADGAGQVERHRGQDEPSRVRGEVPGGQVRQRAALQVGDDLFDDRVPPVITFGLEHRQR